MNATLQHLDLECNKVGDAGAATIAGALCVNRTLKVRNFSSNDKSYRVYSNVPRLPGERGTYTLTSQH